MKNAARSTIGIFAVLIIFLLFGCSTSNNFSEVTSRTADSLQTVSENVEATSADKTDDNNSRDLTTTSLCSQSKLRESDTNVTDKIMSSASTSSVDCNMAKIVPIILPSDQVKTVSQLGYTADTYRAKAVQNADYRGNAGWNVSSIAVSPDYSLNVNGIDVPVYCTPVYVATGNCGALHSFAMIDVMADTPELSVTIRANGFSFSKAVVCPTTLGVAPKTSGRTITWAIRSFGNYTFLVCDSKGDESQQHALTLAVRSYMDEEAEIEAYKAKYGADNVFVYDAGTHMIDYVNIKSSNSVVYLRRGSLLVMKHLTNINSATDDKEKSEKDASSSNGWGLNRYPVISVNNKNNIRIVGRGTIDGGRLDWHERRGIMASYCDGFIIDGINIVNFPEWGVITYVCKNVSIKNVLLFGFRTNSDAFALCNTQNATVTNCFARTGDDMFEVKTLGSENMGKDISQNITYADCVAWGSKARAFGITGEVVQDIRNVTFKDCTVIFRDAIWDNNVLGSLAIIVENGNGNVSDVTFENIQINYDAGRAINIGIQKEEKADNKIDNIVFRNVSYNASSKSRLSTKMLGKNSISVSFQNVIANTKTITYKNVSAFVFFNGPRSKLTVK